jgi:phage protein D
MAGRITSAEIKVKVDGQEVSPNHITSVEVHSDLNQPDMVDICLSNFGDGGGDSGGGGGGLGGILGGIFDSIGANVEASRFSAKFRPGADLEVMMGLEGESPQRVFLGKVGGTTPSFDTHLPATVNVHGMNDLHKLTRERKTRTYTNQKDQDIVSKIASENGLSPKFGKTPPTLLHEHLHQWNMTDLEFLRLRASRTARNLWVDLDNKTLYYVKYEKDQSPVASLSYTEEGDKSLENFAPQSNAGAQTQKVEVYGWDPAKKEKIVGTYTASASPLGSEPGGGAFGDKPTLNVCDVPVRTKEEADLIAESTCTERNMNFITGSATTKGNAKIKVGTVIEMKTNDERYNGKYYISGVRHSFSHGASGLGGGAGMGGFKTSFSFQRDASMGG